MCSLGGRGERERGREGERERGRGTSNGEGKGGRNGIVDFWSLYRPLSVILVPLPRYSGAREGVEGKAKEGLRRD